MDGYLANTALREIRGYLETMLKASQALGQDYIEYYKIKAEMMHRILGVLQTVGLPVNLPQPKLQGED